MSSKALHSPLAPTLLSSWSAAAKGKARASPASTLATHSPAAPTSVPPQPSYPSPSSSSSSSSSSSAASPSSFSRNITIASPSAPDTLPITSTSAALALLKRQPSHYIVASLVGRALLLTTRDVFTIPRLRDVQVGDVLELERIHEVGSRDYTLRAQDPMSTRSRGVAAQIRRSINDHLDKAQLAGAIADLRKDVQGEADPSNPQDDPLVSLLKTSTSSWATRLHPSGLAHVGSVLPPSTVRARCVVVEHTKGALERIVKTKRRKGYKKTIEHKQTYTRLRLESIRLGNGELEG